MRFPSLYKTAFSFFFFVFIISSLPSCYEPLLEEQLVGRWIQYGSPILHPFELYLYPNGGLGYYNPYTNVSDTGSYTIRTEEPGRILTINGLTQTVGEMGWPTIAGEYVILRCDEKYLVIDKKIDTCCELAFVRLE